MSEETSLKKTALTVAFGLLPILGLLSIDQFLGYLNQAINSLSHFAFALIFAQLLCSLVFIKGEICPGQRGRLAKIHSLFGLAWLVWLVFGQWTFFTVIIYIGGLVMTLAAFKQPKESPNLRNKLLRIGVVAGLMASIYYLFQLAHIEFSQLWGIYNPFSQMLLGVILANIALVLSQNRLQGFIALLPFAIAILLLFNIIFVLILLVTNPNAVRFSNEFAVLLYFVLHLAIMAIIAVPILRKTKLDYFALMLIYLFTITLPIWARFAYVGE